MKLFFAPGACSLAPHIILEEIGRPYELAAVSLKSGEGKNDLLKVNPKGAVPTLILDDGQVLTEGAVILQFLGDSAPEKSLVPSGDTLGRYRSAEWLNFVATEMHKGFSPAFRAASLIENETDRPKFVANVAKGLAAKFAMLNEHLREREYLLGEFSVADAYLGTTLRWAPVAKLDVKEWPHLDAYFNRLGARPAVERAVNQEAIRWRSGR